MDNIWLKVNRDVFMQNLLYKYYEKVLLLSKVTSRRDYHSVMCLLSSADKTKFRQALGDSRTIEQINMSVEINRRTNTN